MTICVAAIFRWVYDGEKQDIGPAVVTASDRMLTDEGLGIEYEPNQYKGAHLTDRIMALVSGDVTVHSAVLQTLIPSLSSKPDDRVGVVASMYAQRVRQLIAQRAANRFLSPLGLDANTFLSRQKEMDPALVMELSNRLLDQEVEGEALIVGCEGDTAAHIYSVDKRGAVRCHDDLGFAVVGIGGIHAAGQFMTYSYTNMWGWYPALAITYAAKKRSEIAPGVGKETDMFYITRSGVAQIPQETRTAVGAAFDESERLKKQIDHDLVEKIKEADRLIFAKREADRHKPTKRDEPTDHLLNKIVEPSQHAKIVAEASQELRRQRIERPGAKPRKKHVLSKDAGGPSETKSSQVAEG